MDAITRSRTAEAVEVAGMVYGLGLMDCQWDGLPKSFAALSLIKFSALLPPMARRTLARR